MPVESDFDGLSELEREIELEMDEELGVDEEGGWNDTELELPSSDDEEFELDADGDDEIAVTQERPFEFSQEVGDDYADRFMEIAAREYESESEVDRAMNGVLDDIAQEYLFGSIWKKARRLGGSLAKNKVLGALVKKGLSVASGQLPALKAAMQLAKGDLQGAILNLGKQALGAALPGGPAALAALSALGGQDGQPEAEREVWENYAQVARDAFEHLADNVTEIADEPLEANRLAAAAYQHALRRRPRPAARQMRRTTPPPRSGPATRKVTRYRLRPGEKLVVSGAGAIVIRGG